MVSAMSSAVGAGPVGMATSSGSAALGARSMPPAPRSGPRADPTRFGRRTYTRPRDRDADDAGLPEPRAADRAAHGAAGGRARPRRPHAARPRAARLRARSAFVDDLLALAFCADPDARAAPVQRLPRLPRRPRAVPPGPRRSARRRRGASSARSGESIVAAARRWLLDAAGAPIVADAARRPHRAVPTAPTSRSRTRCSRRSRSRPIGTPSSWWPTSRRGCCRPSGRGASRCASAPCRARSWRRS